MLFLKKSTLKLSPVYINQCFDKWKNRKDKPIGRIFGGPFSWSDAIDAAADVYNGVGHCARFTGILY